MMLGSKEILGLIKEKSMITGYVNFDKQLQPNGFDLTVGKIFRTHCDCGVLSEKQKHLPVKVQIFSDLNGWNLNKGTYIFEVNETVKLPENISAISVQRSSLMRMFCQTQVGSWDAGYHGRGYGLLNVFHPEGLILEKDVRIIQMHFFKTSEVLKKYDGSYQKENLVLHRRKEL